MKHISYYDIVPGSFPLFNPIKGVVPEVILEDAEWHAPRVFSPHAPEVVCVPTWQWDFKSFLDLPKYLHQQMKRDGYYVLTGRECDQERIYKAPDGSFEAYFSCFGMAYSPTPWIKDIHHWTNIEKNSKLPKWLYGWNPDIYSVIHIKQ